MCWAIELSTNSLIIKPNNSTIENNKDGQTDGPFQAFYENGSISAEGIYVAGEREGIFKIFDETGELIEEIVFERSKRIN